MHVILIILRPKLGSPPGGDGTNISNK